MVSGDVKTENGLNKLRFLMIGKDSLGRRIPQFRATEMYSQMLTHFGDRIDVISAIWTPEYNDNLARFNELTGGAEPLSVPDAARATWSGRQAGLFGYTEVEEISLEGVPGAYTSVELQFSRPKN